MLHAYQLKSKHLTNERQILARSKEMGDRLVTIGERTFVNFHDVFPIDLFEDGAFFAEHLSPETSDGSLLEIGSGTGIAAVTALLEGRFAQAHCTDYNPRAVLNTQENVDRHGLHERVRVYQSDMLHDTGVTNMFDAMYWNHPFIWYPYAEDIDMTDLAIVDPKYRSLNNYLRLGMARLKEGGTLWLGTSFEVGQGEDYLRKFFEEYGYFDVTIRAQKEFFEGELKIDYTLLSARR